MIADKILVVDDEEKIRKIFTRLLTDAGYIVKSVDNGLKALQIVPSFQPHIVLMDQNMPGKNGIETMELIHKINPECIVIIITAHGEITLAVEAVKKGAYDYIEKPVDNEKLLLLLKRASEHCQIKTELSSVKNILAGKNSFESIIAVSKSMKQVIAQAKSVCDTDATVLLTGESGTGKEVIANAIHFGSYRKDRPLIAINCGAIPLTLLESELFGHEKGAFTDARESKAGRFEQSDNGTLFLDEVVELPLDAQVKLLRVLEERKVTRVGGKKEIPINVRIISATNKNLEEKVQRGEFRLDLLYRLNIFTINIPPLRDRKEDIPVLVEYLIQKYNSRLKLYISNISENAMELLKHYQWPGNVRDLQNAVQSAMILAKSGTINEQHLPIRIKGYAEEEDLVTNSASGLDENLRRMNEKIEKEMILRILQECRYKKTETARILKVSRKTLFNKMRKYGI